jgi:predicted phage tail protein
MMLKHTMRTHYAFVGNAGQTYRFRIRAVNTAGQAGRWSPRSVSGTATPH